MLWLCCVLGFVCVFGDDSFNGAVLGFMNGLNATCLHDFFFFNLIPCLIDGKIEDKIEILLILFGGGILCCFCFLKTWKS